MRALKNWCFWTVVLKTLQSLLDCKEIQPVHPKGNQSWIFIGRTDAEAETPILQPPHVKSWLNGKDPDAGRDCGQEEKGTTEDEMAGQHHQFDGHESGWTLGVGDGQAGLACCNSWGRKESDTTEWLNLTELRVPTSKIDFQDKVEKHVRYFHRHCNIINVLLLFIVFPSPSHVRLFATPWTAAHQASLSFTISWSLIKLMSTESVMPSNHLILCCPLFLVPSIFPRIRFFSSESILYIRWPKYWSISFSISPSNEYSGLISFRIDCSYLLVVQGTLKSLL